MEPYQLKFTASFLLFCLSILAALLLITGNSRYRIYFRLIVLSGILLAGYIILLEIISSPFKPFLSLGNWNGIRLSWSYSIFLGAELYYPVMEGPILSQLYNPLSALIYLPACFLPSPTYAIIFASLMSACLYFIPAVYLIFVPEREGSKNDQLIIVGLVGLFCLLTTFFSGLSYSAFAIHADAPSLGFAAMACASIYRGQKNSNLLWAAIFSVLSAASKQSFIVLIFAIAIYICLSGRFRDAVKFTVYAIVLGLVVLNVVLLTVNTEGFFVNTVLMHLNCPLIDPIRFRAYLSVFLQMINQNGFPAFLLFLAGVFSLLLQHLSGMSLNVREYFNQNKWTLFMLVFLVMCVSTFQARLNFEGAVNSFSPSQYFLIIALCLGLKHFIFDISYPYHEAATRLSLSILVILTGVLIASQVDMVRGPDHVVDGLKNNGHALTYQYLRKHPQEVYFPNNPLSHQMAEKKTYHCLVCVYHRFLSEVPVKEEHFHQFIPDSYRFVAFPADARYQSEFIFNFIHDLKVVDNSGEFPPGFLVLQKEGG